MPYIGKQPARVPVTASDIPDDSITAAKIVDGAITIADIADDAVTEDKLANAINTAIAANTAKVTNATHTGEVTGATALTIAADAVDGTNIADNSIDSEHYVDGSIDNAHIADDAINSEHYAAGSIDNEHLADDAVGVAELSATGTASSSTFLRGDNSWATVTSVGGATGVDFNDNVKARFGTGNDLEIYHNGSYSIIKDGGTGALALLSNDFQVLNTADSEYMIRGIEDGAVNLYHNGSKKFETTSTGVTVTGAIAGASNLGKCLQVVQTSDTGQETSTSSGWNDLGSLSLSITPSSTSSKIYLMCHLGVIHQTQDTHIVFFRFLRDSTAVGVGSVGNRSGCTASTRGQATGDTNAGFNMAFNYLDSPNTTSAITYKVQYDNYNSGEFHYNRDDGWANTASHPTPISTITAMEIA